MFPFTIKNIKKRLNENGTLLQGFIFYFPGFWLHLYSDSYITALLLRLHEAYTGLIKLGRSRGGNSMLSADAS